MVYQEYGAPRPVIAVSKNYMPASIIIRSE